MGQGNPLSPAEKAKLKFEKLGFESMLHCNVAGVTMGEGRQDHLAHASQFVTASTSLTCFNDGVRLYRDKDNKYDKYAVQVWLAQRKVGAVFDTHAPAGFLPRRICTSCSKSFGGKDAFSSFCPRCGANLDNQTTSWLNKFVCQNYLDQGKGIWYSVWWINQNIHTTPSSWGCQLALAFPTLELKPPV